MQKNTGQASLTNVAKPKFSTLNQQLKGALKQGTGRATQSGK